MNGKIRSLFWSMAAGAVGLLLAKFLVPGFEVVGELSKSLQIILLAGVVLGLINFFIKPVINLITLPLRWLSFGLFGLAINLLIVWLIDIVFSPELTIHGFKALFLTTLLVWLASFFAPRGKKKRKRSSY